MLIHAMRGLGDSIYQRAFMKNLSADTFVDTPWPELLSDTPAKCVRPVTSLRTQAKNAARYSIWHTPPKGIASRKIAYGKEGIINGMRRSFGIEPGAFDLPDFGPSLVSGRYVVVRPVSVRTEWRADSRNPLPEYIAFAADEMIRRGYKVVSVADFEPGKEWPVGELPDADIRFHHGELPVEELLALIQGAEAVIGGIGWIVPACIAAKVPAWIVCGGQGAYNHPKLITDSCMDLSKIHFAMPNNFCMCDQKMHNCDKEIEGYESSFAEWADRLPALV